MTRNGKWILECDGENECDNLYKCSMCGFEYGCEEYDKPNFCPNCGTDMRIDDRVTMTKEKAIQILADLIDSPFLHTWEKQNKALHMAIEALSVDVVSREECDECKTNKEGVLLQQLAELQGDYETMKNAYEDALADAEWIPCSERLPKKGEVVLITNGKGNVRCGQYRSEHDVRDGTHYWWWKGKTVETVLAWMPLPMPYKGGDSE